MDDVRRNLREFGVSVILKIVAHCNKSDSDSTIAQNSLESQSFPKYQLSPIFSEILKQTIFVSKFHSATQLLCYKYLEN